MSYIKTIPEDVMEILKASKIEGDTLTLQGQLDPKTYKKVADCLLKAGGKWDRKRACHVFPGDAKAALGMVLMREECPEGGDNFYKAENNPEGF